MSNASKFTFDLSTGKDIHAPYIEANMTEAIKVTQSEFISTLFGDAKTRGVSRNAKVGAGWHRKVLSKDSEPYPVSMDNYFSVGAFAGEGSGKDDSKRMMVVVADDYPLERLSVEPTYILQTSECKPQPDGSLGASYQVGFAIADGDNLVIADRLMEALYLQGHADKSGNNRVRLARLPQSTNNKHDKPFKTRITRWNPERRFGLMDVARALGVDLSAKPEPIEGAETSSSEKLDIYACVDAVLDGLELHENINRLAMSYIGQGMRRDSVIANLQALMQRVEVKDARWQERYADIERSVDTAIEKAGKVAISQETRWVRLDYDLDTMEATDFLFDGYIEESLLVIGGATGVGKTNAVVTLSVQATGFVGTDGDFLVPRVFRKVIYITEYAPQVKKILSAIKQHTPNNRLGDTEFNNWFQIYESKRLAPEVVARQIKELILQNTVFQDTPNGSSEVMPLVVFDTFAASFNLDDENSSGEVGKCVVSVKEICVSLKSPMIITAHTAKANARADVQNLSVMGSGAFENNAVMVAFVFREPSEGDNTPHRYMYLKKHRYEADFKEVRFTSTKYTAVGIKDSRGFTQNQSYLHLTIEKSSEADRIMLSPDQFAARGKILDWLTEEWDNLEQPPTQNTLDAKFGKSTNVKLALDMLLRDEEVYFSDEDKSDGRIREKFSKSNFNVKRILVLKGHKNAQ